MGVAQAVGDEKRLERSDPECGPKHFFHGLRHLSKMEYQGSSDDYLLV